MNPNSKTQQAKRLYRELRDKGSFDLFFTGLYGEIWISRHDKAYHVKDLGFDHLSNIIAKLKRTGDGEVPKIIKDEYIKKREAYRKNKEDRENEQI